MLYIRGAAVTSKAVRTPAALARTVKAMGSAPRFRWMRPYSDAAVSSVLAMAGAIGGHGRDVTVLPESNNSIQQGGLSFYVIKDDTRKAGPWYDPSFKPLKLKYTPAVQ